MLKSMNNGIPEDVIQRNTSAELQPALWDLRLRQERWCDIEMMNNILEEEIQGNTYAVFIFRICMFVPFP